MENSSKEFLRSILLTPSPTGFEERVQAVVRARMKGIADTIETDVHGNVIACLNPTAKRKIMFAGHCDQIGFMVKHISKEGFVTFAALGGIDAGVCPGAHVVIYAEKGVVAGIFGRKPIHAQLADERANLKIDLDKMWIDIGATSQKDAEKRIKVGDFATFRLEVSELSKDFITAPGLDDKVGLFIVMEALRLLKREKLTVGVYAVSTVQEEVGLRGARTAAYSIDPEVGIAVDVTHASDNPGSDSPRAVPCKLAAGPAIVSGPNINPQVLRLLTSAAKKGKIKYQNAPSAGLLGNDANSIQVSRSGVAAGSIGVPNRYMHTQVEVCSYADLQACAKLLAAFVKEIKPNTSFIPMA